MYAYGDVNDYNGWEAANVKEDGVVVELESTSRFPSSFGRAAKYFVGFFQMMLEILKTLMTMGCFRC